MTSTPTSRASVGRLGDREGVSCAPDRLYGAGGFYDTDITLDRLREIASGRSSSFEVVAEIYPGEKVSRPEAASIVSSNPNFLIDLRQRHAALDTSFQVLPPSLLVRVRDAAVWDNMVFVLHAGAYEPVYEWYRSSDRLRKAAGQATRIRRARLGARQGRGDGPHLFLGSVGSSVYGHWLTDDLPLLKAVGPLRLGRSRVRVAMTSASDAMDAVRADSLSELTAGREHVEATFHRGSTIQPYDELYVVTPASSPPMLKSSHALAFLRSTQSASPSRALAAGDRIFVGRSSAYGRHLVNGRELARRLRGLGFEEIHPELLPVGAQWRAFGAARAIVGAMGSAMANTAFSPAGAAVLHLSPDGWLDPFFWDLAGACGHGYRVHYGSPPDRADGSFSVDVDAVVRQVEAMLAPL